MCTDDRLTIVAIGISASGINALGSLFSKLDFNLNVSYIVMQQNLISSSMQLITLLKTQTDVDFDILKDDATEIKPKKIYICMEPRHIKIENHKIFLGEKINIEDSIDSLFKSVALEYKEDAVGILLSGSGDDGVNGIVKIKEEGGWTIVQDPSLATYPTKPQRAIDTNSIDFVLPIRDIPAYISEITNEPHILIKELYAQEYSDIIDFMAKRRDTQFSNYKKSTIKRRIKNRISTLGLKTAEKYLELLNNDEDEINNLVNNLLINVTSFFRDNEAFLELKDRLVTLLLNKNQSDSIRIWVTGCSTGEEAYSIAITLYEILGTDFINRDIKIFATDIDNEAIEKARHGFYLEDRLEHIPDDIVSKYFNKTEKGYKVIKNIRSVIVFGINDLTSAAPIAKVDLITCRNVLIYFDKVLQKKVLRLFHYALNKDGILFLGRSESNLLAPDIFTPLNSQLKIYQKIDMNISIADRKVKIRESEEVQKAVVYSGLKYNEISRFFEKILQNTNDSIISVNKENKIISLNRSAVELFDLNENNILYKDISNVLNGFVESELLSDIDRVIKTNDATKRDMYKCIDKYNNEKYFTISYIPFGDGTNVVDQVIMIIREVTQLANLKTEVFELKQQNQEHLSQLSILNEELQSSNEELESTNEELQATNEELETINDELQSMNDILESTNSKLLSANLELKTLYDEQELQSLELVKLNESLEKQVNEKIDKIREQDSLLLQQSNLAQMGEMINMIAHQWRQPLNSMSASAIHLELLNNFGTLSQENIKETSIFIQNKTQEMSNIIEEFMNFNKPSSDDTFVILDAILSVNKIVQQQFKSKSIDMNVDIDEELKVFHNVKAIEHSIMNLLINSRDAFEDNNIDGNRYIKIYAKKKGSVVELIIEDNAGGIPIDIIGKIFNPYYTTKEQGKGTGIGLYMTKRMIESVEESTIKVESFDNRTLFTLTFKRVY